MPQVGQAFIDSLKQSIATAREAMERKNYQVATTLATDALTDLHAKEGVSRRTLPLLSVYAIKLYCIRGSSLCWGGKHFDQAQADFEQAATIARHYLPAVSARQHLANAQLNLAIAMLCWDETSPSHRKQLFRATKLLSQCGDAFSSSASQLLVKPARKQHLRW